jgi:hypothetical protein
MSSDLSVYEQQRLQNIEDNWTKLNELGLAPVPAQPKASGPVRRPSQADRRCHAAGDTLSPRLPTVPKSYRPRALLGQ